MLITNCLNLLKVFPFIPMVTKFAGLQFLAASYPNKGQKSYHTFPNQSVCFGVFDILFSHFVSLSLLNKATNFTDVA